MNTILRETVRAVLSESKTITVEGQNRSDIEMAIQWAQANNAIEDMKPISKTSDNKYTVKIITNNARNLISLIKSRYGAFLEIY